MMDNSPKATVQASDTIGSQSLYSLAKVSGKEQESCLSVNVNQAIELTATTSLSCGLGIVGKSGTVTNISIHNNDQGCAMRSGRKCF